MNKWMKYGLFSAALASLAVIIGICCSVQSGRRELVACNDIVVELPDTFKFITGNEIKSRIKSECGDVTGRQIDSIDLKRIETVLGHCSAVLRSEAWTTSDGKLHVLVKQRHPAVCFRKDDREFYSDYDGFIFPAQNGYSADVPCIRISNGTLNEKWTRNTLGFIRFIGKSSGWKERISDIRATGDGMLSFRVDEGNERIMFGKPENTAEKFERLEAWCGKIRPEGRKYSTVDISFEGRVICK